MKPRHHQKREEQHGALVHRDVINVEIGLSQATLQQIARTSPNSEIALQNGRRLSLSPQPLQQKIPEMAKNITPFANQKRDKVGVSTPFAIVPPSTSVSAPVTAINGGRRRASTVGSRNRIAASAGAKQALVDHYACTFKPKINDLSRKLDAKNNGRSPGAQKISRQHTKDQRNWGRGASAIRLRGSSGIAFDEENEKVDDFFNTPGKASDSEGNAGYSSGGGGGSSDENHPDLPNTLKIRIDKWGRWAQRREAKYAMERRRRLEKVG